MEDGEGRGEERERRCGSLDQSAEMMHSTVEEREMEDERLEGGRQRREPGGEVREESE